MRSSVVAALVLIALAGGLLLGGLVSRPSRGDEHSAPPRDAGEALPARRSPWDPTTHRLEHAPPREDTEAGAGPGPSPQPRTHESTREDRERLGDDEIAPPPAAIESLTRELAALKRENAELREEHAELLGEPLPQPTEVEPRFSGPTLGASITGAIGQAGVEGEVEHVDCSEYPCITFGRLAGDEEDMEEIERAAALSEYDADVLTLLFWAATADSSDAPGAKETGLFAIAFYTQDDRANDGAALDRRIRARTIEYWNTDRPARPAAAALD